MSEGCPRVRNLRHGCTPSNGVTSTSSGRRTMTSRRWNIYVHSTKLSVSTFLIRLWKRNGTYRIHREDRLRIMLLVKHVENPSTELVPKYLVAVLSNLVARPRVLDDDILTPRVIFIQWSLLLCHLLLSRRSSSNLEARSKKKQVDFRCSMKYETRLH